MAYVQVPREIVRVVAGLDHRGVRWVNWELPSGRFVRWDDLTIGHCEQLVESYTRRARRSIETFSRSGVPSTAQRAGEFIHRARQCRDRYLELLGRPPDEGDMPFPLASEEEIRAREAGDQG